MKFGDTLEQESVPEWSLHNVDYNSLKHEIKVHTTRDQATAITIPGRHDLVLEKFEDRLYLELCGQHDRVDLFVTSKADEIARRLDHISTSIRRLTAKCTRSGEERMSLRRQRQFAKYERELLRCGDDLQALGRFVNAQLMAFRKITKKYKKWTGSPTLGARFRENILNQPKSIAHRDYYYLQNRYDDIFAALRAASPEVSEPSSPSSDEQPFVGPTPQLSSTRDEFTPLPPPTAHYWNEYDDGSDIGRSDDDYAIFISPDDTGALFPSVASARRILASPLVKARAWFSPRLRARATTEHRGLLDARPPGALGYATMATDTDDDEAEYTSSEEYPVAGYAARYAPLPSIDDQRAVRYREKVLFRAAVGGFAISFLLTGIAAMSMVTGRHKLRLEVDAGVTVGIIASLFSGATALAMSLLRRDRLSIWHRATVGVVFLTVCVLNAMLLILVMEW